MYELLAFWCFRTILSNTTKNSWMIAAAEKNLPLVVPGWEDSTLGNIFASYCIKKRIESKYIKNGIEYMMELANYIPMMPTVKKALAFFKLVAE